MRSVEAGSRDGPEKYFGEVVESLGGKTASGN